MSLEWEDRRWFLWERSLYFIFAQLPSLEPVYHRRIITAMIVTLAVLIILPLAILVILFLPIVAHFSTRALPAPRGPLVVSFSDMWLPVELDPRASSGGDGPPGKRHFLRCRVYFPSEHSERKKPSWLPSPVCEFSSAYGLFMNLPSWVSLAIGPALRNIKSPCSADGPPQGPGAAELARREWPLVIFSHGLGGCRSTYGVLCAEMASWGAVVVAPEHQDESAVLTHRLVISSEKSSIADAVVVPIRHRSGGNSGGDGWRQSQLRRRRAETVAIVEALREIKRQLLRQIEGNPLIISSSPGDYDERSLFFNSAISYTGNTAALAALKLASLDTVALVGHSFGGSTMIDVASSSLSAVALDVECDSRAAPSRQKFDISCVAALDPWMSPLEGGLRLASTTLVLATQSMMYPENVDSMVSLVESASPTKSQPHATGSGVFVEVAGTRHQDQSDVPACTPLACQLFCMGSPWPQKALHRHLDVLIAFLAYIPAASKTEAADAREESGASFLFPLLSSQRSKNTKESGVPLTDTAFQRTTGAGAVVHAVSSDANFPREIVTDPATAKKTLLQWKFK